MSYKIAKCPICKQLTFGECVTHTSEKYCPKKYLGKIIHIQCAKKVGIVTPNEQRSQEA